MSRYSAMPAYEVRTGRFATALLNRAQCSRAPSRHPIPTPDSTAAAAAAGIPRPRTWSAGTAACTERGTAAVHARALLARISQTKDGKSAAAKHRQPQANGRRQLDGIRLRDRCPRREPAQDSEMDQAAHPDHRRPARRHQQRACPPVLRRRRGAQRARQAHESVLRLHVPRRPATRRRRRPAHRQPRPVPGTRPVGRHATDELRTTVRQPHGPTAASPENAAPSSTAQTETPGTCPSTPTSCSCCASTLSAYGTGPGGRILIGPRGGILTDRAYLKVFHEARAVALTPDEAASSLLEVPYALRHAAVSTWLRTAGDPARVAEWAGHSVAVLLRVYAKCIDSMEDEVLGRIWDATGSILHPDSDPFALAMHRVECASPVTSALHLYNAASPNHAVRSLGSLMRIRSVLSSVKVIDKGSRSRGVGSCRHDGQADIAHRPAVQECSEPGRRSLGDLPGLNRPRDRNALNHERHVYDLTSEYATGDPGISGSAEHQQISKLARAGFKSQPQVRTSAAASHSRTFCAEFVAATGTTCVRRRERTPALGSSRVV